MRTRVRTALFLMAVALIEAHEGGQKNRKPTAAEADLKQAAAQLKLAKKKLAAQGRYSCCVRPSCDLCARTNGSCQCAANAAAGRGVCGECYAGWLGGRGAVKGVSSKSIQLLPSEHQACPLLGARPTELEVAAAALLNAKRTLVAEKRFSCCVQGGCGQCAHEADCPCGADLAAKNGKGVCGDCLDGWRSGRGSFAGVDPAEVTLAPMSAMGAAMGTGGGDDGGVYASGTSQQPQSAPMEMLHARFRGWNLMQSGTLFTVYTAQTGPRGSDKLFSTNWFMTMASRRLGPGTLTLRSMLSLEPATITSRRYPLLFQAGETAFGVPIINGQHPHDLFMELAASYQIRLGERTAINLYGGPRGEPALGPVAYPHRASNSENPIAVISHHFQDSTHIATNVVTAGITHRALTWEVSGFHGREPDEKRWGIEGGGIDSLSTRLTVTPSREWSGQFSIGRINNREATHPIRDSLRTSASLTYARPMARGHWATTAIWGRNHDLPYTQTTNVLSIPFGGKETTARAAIFLPDHIVSGPARIPGQIYNSFLIESTLRFKNRNWIWARAESADKDSVLLYEEAPFLLLVDEQRFTRVQAYTAGYERELRSPLSWLQTGLGGQMMWFSPSAALEPVYGRHPLGFQFFLRLRLAKSDR